MQLHLLTQQVIKYKSLLITELDLRIAAKYISTLLKKKIWNLNLRISQSVLLWPLCSYWLKHRALKDPFWPLCKMWFVQCSTAVIVMSAVWPFCLLHITESTCSVVPANLKKVRKWSCCDFWDFWLLKRIFSTISYISFYPGCISPDAVEISNMNQLCSSDIDFSCQTSLLNAAGTKPHTHTDVKDHIKK